MIPFSFLFFYFSTLALVLYVEVSVVPYTELFFKKFFSKIFRNFLQTFVQKRQYK